MLKYYLILLLWIATQVVGSTSTDSYDQSWNVGSSEVIDSNYKFMIVIDPINGVDDEVRCYPADDGGMSTMPCQSLNFALHFQYRSSIKYHLNSSNATYHLLSDHNVTRFINENTIGFYGYSGPEYQLPTVECDQQFNISAGFSFVNSSNIVFHGLKFLHCGAPQSSTSINFTDYDRELEHDLQLLMIRVSLHFYNCTNVEMYRVVVTSSTQALGVVMYDNDGVINITSCNFTDNKVSDDRQFLGGGGFAIEFTYCKPGDNKCNNKDYVSYHKKNKNAIYFFSSCIFKGNNAHGQTSTDYGGKLSLASNSTHQAVGRGGGLSFYFKGNATNNSLTMSDCYFIDNAAVWGGALLVEMDDNANNNSIHISDCEFQSNHAYYDKDYGTEGGGILIASTMYSWEDVGTTLQNVIHILHSNFKSNRALEGGAISILISRQKIVRFDQLTDIVVSSCWFESNEARLGSALNIILYPIVNNGYLPTMYVRNSTFLGNSITYSNKTVHPVGTGAIYVNEIFVAFQERISFLYNSGSALSAVGTQINFDGASTCFIGNKGLLGGGISLLGAAYAVVGESTEMIFVDNYATLYGGAIYNEYTSREDLKSNINCFIRYKIPFTDPPKWTAKFYFFNNTANKKGHSIYSSAIHPCSYGNSDVHQIFCWNSTYWNYGNATCEDQIHTQSQSFTLEDGKNLSDTVMVYPGHGLNLPIVAWDDLGHDVTNDSVYYAYSNDTSVAEVEPGYTHVAANYISITGEPYKKITLVLQTERSSYVHVNLNIQMQPCPLGFFQSSKGQSTLMSNATLEKNKIKCECYEERNYQGKLKCLPQEFHSEIHATYWYGPTNSSEVNHELFLMGHAPLLYLHADRYFRDYRELPKSAVDLNKKLCGGTNRQGVLCGECLPGYAVAANSPNYECVICNHTDTGTFIKNWCIYLSLTYCPIFMLLVIMVLFKIKLTSGKFAGYGLFAQMIGSEIFDPTAGIMSYRDVGRIPKTIQTIYLTMYDIFNMKSFAFFVEPFCLFRTSNTLTVMSLDYVIAAFPLLLILVIWTMLQICNRKCCVTRQSRMSEGTRRTESNYGALEDGHGITIGSTNDSTRDGGEKNTRQQSTSWIADSITTSILLSYTKFSLTSMSILNVSQLFDAQGNNQGSRSYFAGQISMGSSEFIIPFALPAAVIMFLCLVLPIILLITASQKVRDHLSPDGKILQFVNSFQSCYADEFQFRIFSSVYVFFRLGMLASLVFTQTLIQQYAIQQITITVVIFLVAFLKPYSGSQKLYHYKCCCNINFADTFLFLILGILNTGAIYMLTTENYTIDWMFGVECVLVFLPAIIYGPIIFYQGCCNLKQLFTKIKML